MAITFPTFQGMPLVIINRPIRAGASDKYNFEMKSIGSWGRTMSREYDTETYLIVKHTYILTNKIKM